MNVRRQNAARILEEKVVAVKEVHFLVEVFDALQGKSFTGIVKMINGFPRGSFVTFGQSPLSKEAIQAVRSKVLNEHNSKK
ncbi:hypothetical protein IUK39_03735 [Priestia aryabhattai]|uniref:hypothetical protein n=1 Tax=Priestia aryabhattai TaxID=412384 RepID=UPI001C0DDBB3|nr:hypothetical protein [Priestia aryabhattai]MBU3569289.1 hypothetical protein [Priestia aryabhattai]